MNTSIGALDCYGFTTEPPRLSLLDQLREVGEVLFDRPTDDLDRDARRAAVLHHRAHLDERVDPPQERLQLTQLVALARVNQHTMPSVRQAHETYTSHRGGERSMPISRRRSPDATPVNAHPRRFSLWPGEFASRPTPRRVNNVNMYGTWAVSTRHLRDMMWQDVRTLRTQFA